MLEVESEVRPCMNMELFIDVSPVLSKRCAEEPDGSSHSVSLLRPHLSATVGGGWSIILLARESLPTASPVAVLMGI